MTSRLTVEMIAMNRLVRLSRVSPFVACVFFVLLAGQESAAQPRTPFDPAQVAAVRGLIERTPVDQIDAAFMRRIFSQSPDAAKIVGQVMADPALADKNYTMGNERREMDLRVWNRLLAETKVRVEFTNQGKSNGIRSDLDYTLYFIAQEAGIPVSEMIDRHRRTWIDMWGLPPEQVEITVMNGDDFYPDWRGESLSSLEFQAATKKTMLRLRRNPEAYWVPGATRQQVVNRALREGRTTLLQYDALSDRPIFEEGPTSEMAVRYQGVHPQYDYKNALGNVIQNLDQLTHKTGGDAQSAIQRAKYFNRVVNEGLGNLHFFANSYAEIDGSSLPDARKLELKQAFLAQVFGPLGLLGSELEEIRATIDLSMQIERDKVRGTADYTQARERYFAPYRAEAERLVDLEVSGRPLWGAERLEKILQRQEALFLEDQKRIVGLSLQVSLDRSARRDLTPEGALRNALRFEPDPATGRPRAVMDARRLRNVAFERSLEVVAMFELLNNSHDPRLRSLAQTFVDQTSDPDLRRFYRSLSTLTSAEIDHFLEDADGRAGTRLQTTLDEFIEAKLQRCRRAGIALVDPDEAGRRIGDEVLRQHVVNRQTSRLEPAQRTAFQAVADATRTTLGGFAAEAYSKATPLMLGSTAVNLIQAYQTGNPHVLTHAMIMEAVNFMPQFVDIPFSLLDAGMKATRGQYAAAAWTIGLPVSLYALPSLGQALLIGNIISGSYQITRVYVMTRTMDDFVDQAFTSRPRDNLGNPLPVGVMARRNPHRSYSSFRGQTPRTPLFYDSIPVPEDEKGDAELAMTASVLMAGPIKTMLEKEGLTPGTQLWEDRARELSFDLGWQLPYFARMAEMYAYIERETRAARIQEPQREDEILRERFTQEVESWYDAQPDVFKTSAEGYYDVVFGSSREAVVEALVTHALAQYKAQERAEIDREMALAEAEEALRNGLERAATVEKQILATKERLQQSLGETLARKAEAAAEAASKIPQRYSSVVRLDYPFTFTTEELPPVFDVTVHTLPAHHPLPLEARLTEALVSVDVGAPAGWAPITEEWKQRLESNTNGRPHFLPVTVVHRWTAEVVDAAGSIVGADEIEIPVVYYLENPPAFSGGVTVKVRAAGETDNPADFVDYAGAPVRIASLRDTTDVFGMAGVSGLDAGTYSVEVEPRPGDARHGPGSATVVVSDPLQAVSGAADAGSFVEVILPYRPEPTEQEASATPPEAEGPPPDEQGPDEDIGPPGPPPDPPIDPVRVAAFEQTASGLERERDAAIARCDYASATSHQRALVAEAERFLAAVFPTGAPAEIEARVASFRDRLAALSRAADAEDAAKDHLRAARAHFLARDVESALNSLEAAMTLTDLPQCLYDQIRTLYDEVSADVEDIMELIERAVAAANEACDYALALQLGRRVEAAAPTLSWVTSELPRIAELAKRQETARRLAGEAEALMRESVSRRGSGDEAGAAQAVHLANERAAEALDVAPACERDALLARLQAAQQSAPPSPVVEKSIVLLIDTSGSMGDNNKMEQAREAASQTVRSLPQTVETAVLSYSGGCSGGWRVVENFTGDQARLLQAIASLSPGGGTPMAPAIGFAQQYLEQNGRGAVGQLILLSDGQNDCGSVQEAGAGLRSSRIPVRIDAIGFGLEQGGTAETELGVLVGAAGNGRQYSANSADELISVFRRAFVAEQLKLDDPLIGGVDRGRLSELFRAAAAHLRAENVGEAVDVLSRAADGFPHSPSAHFNLSLGYEADRQLGPAIDHAQEYLRLAPGAPDAAEVQSRIAQLTRERQGRDRFDPAACGYLVTWANGELQRAGRDSGRRATVYDILILAQRGDCSAAERAYQSYVGRR